VKAAVADCKEIFGDAKDDLNRTVKGVDAKDGVSKEGYQLRIWLSAVIAHMETCIDGFPDDDFKVKVKESFTSGKELTSNALALIEKGSSLLSRSRARNGCCSARRREQARRSTRTASPRGCPTASGGCSRAAASRTR